jgi:heptosyltransferase-2
VRRCASATFLAGPPKLDNSEHAACQLARPLQSIGLSLSDSSARLFPSDEDRRAVRNFCNCDARTAVAGHPGSGSETKNWPVENWIKLGHVLLTKATRLIIIAGEADADRTRKLRSAWREKPVQFAENLSLPHLTALLEHLSFIGHDSGISHIAAAAGARCLLLFGWTDPAIWSPVNSNVTVLRAPKGKMADLNVDAVVAAYELMRIGIRT